MKTKKGEKEKLRTVILEKTLMYLKRHGRVGAGTEDMMRQVGLTRGALYSHFKSKDDLFAQAVCYDLANLEALIAQRIEDQGSSALKSMIEDHLSERSLDDVGSSCVFTSLSSDMQRCKPSHRALFESFQERIFSLFARALHDQFPRATSQECRAMATNLYSGLVGTLTMARTMKDRERALEILVAGKKHLIRSFTQGDQTK